VALGACKLCRENGPFAKAHIVPKAFYSIVLGDPLRVLSGKAGHRPRRAPVGIYDEQLICRSCESEHSYLDDYAIRVLKPWPKRSQLIKDETGFIIKIEGKPAGYYVRRLDAEKLTLFFYFLLWRMGATTRSELHVNLSATLSEQLCKSVIAKKPCDLGLKIFAARFHQRAAANVVFGPRIRASDSELLINFDFYGFQFTLTSDDNPEVRDFALSGQDWPILFEDFRKTKVCGAFKSLAMKGPSHSSRAQNVNAEVQ
jgi:hypothetical protein